MAGVNVVELIYPVGSVYISDNISQSPTDMFGGNGLPCGKITTATTTTPSGNGQDIYCGRRVS